MRGPWNQAYDLDALTTMERKASYLQQAIERRWWLAFAHDEQILAAQVKNDRGKIALDAAIARQIAVAFHLTRVARIAGLGLSRLPLGTNDCIDMGPRKLGQGICAGRS